MGGVASEARSAEVLVVSHILWLASYPKSGNTWLRAFLANFLSNPPRPIHINDLDQFIEGDMRAWPYERILGGPIDQRPVEDIYAVRTAAHRLLAETKPGIVFVKTHNRIATFDGVPTITPEVTFGAIYVIRNPLDVMMSYARHYGISIDDAITGSGADLHFLPKRPGKIDQDLGTWSQHVRGWTQAPGMYRYVMRYEDMLRDPVKIFGSIADFLGTPKNPARIRKAVKFSSFGELAGQESKDGFVERSSKSDRFFTAGKAGGWQTALTREQIERTVELHGAVMADWGYLDPKGEPLVYPRRLSAQSAS